MQMGRGAGAITDLLEEALGAAAYAATWHGRLAALTEALLEAEGPTELFGRLVRGVAPLGVARGWMGLLESSGDALGSFAYVGDAGGDPFTFDSVPLDAPLPIAACVASRRPILVETAAQATAEFPRAGAMLVANGTRAFAALPFVARGRVVGAMVLGFSESHAFDEDERDFLVALARLATAAIERARLHDAAERANRQKDEFLAMLGHELRNPLAPIVTGLELLRRRSQEPEASEWHVVDRQVRHLVSLVEDLLDLSRIAQGRIRLERAPILLSDVIERALEMAQPRLSTRRHALAIEIEPGLAVDGDGVRLAQLVANLVDNAAKYTPPGGHVTVSATRVGDEAVLRVRDDGIGIAADLLARIFEPFVQAPRSLDRAEGGMGLGLAVVRRLAELHGGSAQASSDGPGCGAEMTVRLPALAEPLAVERRPAAAVVTGVVPRRILVVDDNEDAASVLAEGLSLSGHVTAVAHDGATALALAERFTYDVALLDIGLPGMDGHSLARALAARLDAEGRRRGVAFVAVTGYGQQADRDRSIAAGFDAHLVKPVTLRELEALLARFPPPSPARSPLDPSPTEK